MYNTFKAMVKDIFNNEDFVQYCYINGFQYKCLVSSISNDSQFSIAGLVDLVKFTLDLEIDQFFGQYPKQGDEVIFRDNTYQVSHTDIDSALATMKIYLISVSKGK